MNMAASAPPAPDAPPASGAPIPASGAVAPSGFPVGAPPLPVAGEPPDPTEPPVTAGLPAMPPVPICPPVPPVMGDSSPPAHAPPQIVIAVQATNMKRNEMEMALREADVVSRKFIIAIPSDLRFLRSIGAEP